MDAEKEKIATKQLKDENALLDQLVKTASGFGELGGAWVDYFELWKKLNVDILDDSDGKGMSAELSEELTRIQAMHDSIKGDTNGAKYWRNMLQADIKNLKSLGVS